MATSALPLVGIALLTLSACDLSQKKPETIRASLPHAQSTQTLPSSLGGLPLPPAQAPQARGASATGVEKGAGERSIRLYGPGVSRKRQIRV